MKYLIHYSNGQATVMRPSCSNEYIIKRHIHKFFLISHVYRDTKILLHYCSYTIVYFNVINLF